MSVARTLALIMEVPDNFFGINCGQIWYFKGHFQALIADNFGILARDNEKTETCIMQDSNQVPPDHDNTVLSTWQPVLLILLELTKEQKASYLVKGK